MAEAIGLIASCLSILKAIETVNKFARQNIHTNASATKELSPLLGKLSAYEGLIRGIKLQADLDEDDQNRLSVLNHIDGPLNACETALQTISQRLETLPKHVLLGKIIDKKTSLALEALESSKPILELALDADQRTITKSIEAYVRNIHEDLKVLRLHNEESLSLLAKEVAIVRAVTAGEELERRRTAEQRSLEEVLMWISTVDPSSNFRSAQKCLQGGDSSGSWLLQAWTFDEWLFGELPRLWLYGASGSGKTVLTSKIIDVLGRRLAQTGSKVPILYFFFDFNDPSKQEAEDQLRSLILQLAAQRESTVTFLQALYSEHQAQPKRMAPAVRTWTDVLLKLLQKQDACYIVIDALDECATLYELMEEISFLLKSAEPFIRWLFVSQAAVEISNGFMECPSPSVVKIEIQSSAVDKDIGSYVRRRLKTDARLKSFPPLIKDRIIKVMDEKASGMFRWAQCQLDVLSKLRDRRSVNVEKALERLPTDLHVTYQRLLAAIPDDDRALVLRMLNFIALSARPVTLDEVAEYAIIEDGMVLVTSANRFADCSDVLQLCGNLVSLQDDILSLAHKSVKDFLLSPDVTGRPANEYDDLEIEIGRTCLTYLSFPGNTDNVKVGAHSTEHLERLRENFPLIEYSAAMWPSHVRSASHQSTLKGLMQCCLNILGDATLWRTWLILQPADIWDNQIQLALFLCEAVIRSPDVPGWALDFWDIRQALRKKDLSRSPNDYPSLLSRTKSPRPGYQRVQTSARKFFPRIRGKQEYTLAVILLEVALQRSFEKIVEQEESLGSTYDTLDSHLQLLHDKSEKAQSRMGQKYGDVVRDCIRLATFGTENLPGVATVMSADQKQQILWEKSYKPLQQMARAGFARTHGFRAEPDGEEDGVFGFFSAGVNVREVHVKDEGSESILSNFAALLDGRAPSVDEYAHLHNEASNMILAKRPPNHFRAAPPSADGVFYGAFSSSFFGRAGLSRVLEPWNFQGTTA